MQMLTLMVWYLKADAQGNNLDMDSVRFTVVISHCWA